MTWPTIDAEISPTIIMDHMIVPWMKATTEKVTLCKNCSTNIMSPSKNIQEDVGTKCPRGVELDVKSGIYINISKITTSPPTSPNNNITSLLDLSITTIYQTETVTTSSSPVY